MLSTYLLCLDLLSFLICLTPLLPSLITTIFVPFVALRFGLCLAITCPFIPDKKDAPLIGCWLMFAFSTALLTRLNLVILHLNKIQILFPLILYILSFFSFSLVS